MPLPSPLRAVASAQAHAHAPAAGLPPVPSEGTQHPHILPPISKLTDSPVVHNNNNHNNNNTNNNRSPSSSSASSASKPSSPFGHSQQPSQQPGSIMSAIPQPRDFHHGPPSAASSIRSDYYRDQQQPPAAAAAPAQYSSYRPPTSAYSSDQQPQPPQPYTSTQSGMNVQSWYGQASAPRSVDTSSQAYPQYARESIEYQGDSRRGSVTSVDSMQYTTSQRAPSPGSRNSSLDLRYTSKPSSGGSRVNAPRGAPPITNATPYAPHPNAPSPTKGYPYAFPDPGASLPSTQSLQAPPPTSQYFPNGSTMLGYSHAANASRTSIDSYDRMSARSLDLDEQAAATAQAAGVGPYSRSPELRQTHKIAERKRRRDMSLLYEDLKEILPDEKGVKSSKHEILVRAISVIRKLNRNNDELRQEVNDLRAKLGMPPKKFAAIGVSSNGTSMNRGNRESTAGSELDDADDDDHEAMDESK
ncbi:hypothetical protein POJ06DRAFT_252649 [Lipomyces tetrasporus]|uniref:BHLH domain-containing protein n=1 Tax=Lipomyces tetrasporus TaxID=54092 RepID=A0AAD7QRY5_9ASCO|nr:uncharacterized protein POJ06DRAFT_252649 [Lipomyces tetrasporus]KAJ8100414.1 hypothetical protein POJ06DRAFT_252649 [Lipomyces tetrasporus]